MPAFVWEPVGQETPLWELDLGVGSTPPAAGRALDWLLGGDGGPEDLFLGGLARSVGRAAKGAVKGIGQAAKAVGKVVPVGQIADFASKATPLGAVARGAFGALSAVAKGENVLKGALGAVGGDPISRFAIRAGTAVAGGENLLKAAKMAASAGINDARQSLRFASMVAGFVPGVGTGVSAALGAANALASGQPITEALIAGARGALPGGPLAQAAFDVARNLAQGKNVAAAALEAARGQLPGGKAAQAAFDAAVALARGQTLQQAAFAAAGSVLPKSPYAATALSFVRDVAAGKNVQQAALSAAGRHVMRTLDRQGANIVAVARSHVPAARQAGVAVGGVIGGGRGLSRRRRPARSAVAPRRWPHPAVRPPSFRWELGLAGAGIDDFRARPDAPARPTLDSLLA